MAPFTDGTSKRSRFGVRPRPPVPLPEVDRLLAGVAEVDITPPPGMPKAGYSANAHDGNGFRTRLRARVTYLRSGRSSIALVQLDLLGGSSVLQHLVAEAVADRTDIPLAGVWIGATHTHAGPGQFLGTDFYNRHASNRGGFDPAWTQFLVDRIAGAVIEAHDTRVPARAALGSTEVWGLTRNRSHDPHVQNATVTDKRRDPQRKWVAVNPLLHLLRVDRVTDDGGTEPLGAAVVFSVHGTGVSQHAHEYNADVWAYLVGELRHRIETAHGVRPVVGAMEGTHADVAPALRPGLAGHREARRIGCGIGAEAAALHERLGAELADRVPLDAGLREVDLDVDRVVDGVELPDRPAVGAALVAGATENLTPVIHRIPPFRAGMPKRWGTDNPQGEKWVIGSRWLQPFFTPTRSFPRVLAVQALRIGDAVLVGLPFEITVESGRRIGAAVADAVADRGIGRVVVSSVVNEYWGYVTTAEEYRRQYYEGGHTLYGPNTQPFLAAHARRLAEATVGAGTFADVEAERRWDLASHRYLPHPPAVEGPDRRFTGKATFTDPTAEEDGHWEQAWVDVEPAGLRWHEPLVRVEASDDDGATWAPAVAGGIPADDQGWAVEVSHLGADDAGHHHYRARWYDPSHRFGRRHRFVLLANGDRPELAGAPFD
ncbi:MAG TPA: neutral/alkaline non-lysosomal ceramidase N-terminal domain-containing protein [Aquihabitans sp.]|nr:neutral/alkaline non-lysosomal ceramidase N-terminal domain-containing protein [Aquihabitans sp.]